VYKEIVKLKPAWIMKSQRHRGHREHRAKH
jgi:hypothetical protein